MSRSRRSSLGGSKDDFDKELAMVTDAVAVGLLDYDMQKLNRDWFPLEAAAKATEAELIDTHCHMDFIYARMDLNCSFSDFKEKLKNEFPTCFSGCISVFCEPSKWTKVNLDF